MNPVTIIDPGKLDDSRASGSRSAELPACPVHSSVDSYVASSTRSTPGIQDDSRACGSRSAELCPGSVPYFDDDRAFIAKESTHRPDVQARTFADLSDLSKSRPLKHTPHISVNLASFSMKDRYHIFAAFEESAVALDLKAFRDTNVHSDKILVVLPQGLQVHRTDRLVETVGLKHLREGHTDFDPRCSICIEAKLQSKPARRVERDDTTGEVSADTAGPLPISINGSRFGLVCVIRKSRYGLVEALKNKEAPTLKDARINCKLHQRQLWRFHSDQGREFLGECQRWLRGSGIVITDTGGYREPANGIAERRIKEIFQIARALLLQGNAPKLIWDESFLHSNALIRTIPGNP
jgi:hypothetical protein